MNRPSKKDIRAAIEKLKAKPSDGPVSESDSAAKPLPTKKVSQRIRKKGI